MNQFITHAGVWKVQPSCVLQIIMLIVYKFSRLVPEVDNTQGKGAKLNYLSWEVFVFVWFIMCYIKNHHSSHHEQNNLKSY